MSNSTPLQTTRRRANLCIALATVILAGSALPSDADSPFFVIDPAGLPFDLSPRAPINAPHRQGNRPHDPANSAAQPANSPRLRANAPDNPDNGPEGHRRLLAPDGEMLGYYTGGRNRTLNLWTRSGKRGAYRPAHSSSVFSPKGQWCGTVAEVSGGGFAFGLTRECARPFGW